MKLILPVQVSQLGKNECYYEKSQPAIAKVGVQLPPCITELHATKIYGVAEWSALPWY